jgi:type IV pilus assembly protein PilB
VEFEDLPILGSSETGPVEEPAVADTPPAGAGIAPNPVTQLVVDLLEATKLISPDRLAQALSRAGTGSIADALIDEDVIPPAERARARGLRYHLPFVDLGALKVDVGAATAIPLHVLERVIALPFRFHEGRLQVAIADPTTVLGVDELRLATRHALDIQVAPEEDIQLELKRMARANEALERTGLVDVEYSSEEDGAELEADDGVSDAPLVRLVNSILLQAAEDGASDVHFDPTDEALVVRFRVDGVLQEVQRVPRRLAPGVTTRLNVLAKLDIAERRKPQDGRISLSARAAGRELDIRVAILPTVEGEGVVLRLLDKSKRAPTLTELGLSDEMRATFEEIIRKPTGAILVTGPTGSGKSTTLYAALTEINRPEINVITVEDPVEYRLTGVNQVQMNAKAGLTFASALRSILRSDPDVIMVGEIRDVETAKISIESALTGHFVLSTLHTNDAPSAISRLNEMGVEPFLTGAAVTAVLAQRLARKLCSHCCEMYIPTREEMLDARFSPEQIAAADGFAVYRRRGCPRCNQTGYKGRIGVFQLMVMSEELSALATRHASRDELERAAFEGGMRTLWQDGLAKVISGLTSIEELGRVLI